MFEIREIRDQVKRDFIDNDIYLLEIPYWEIDNVEKILSDTLNFYYNNS